MEKIDTAGPPTKGPALPTTSLHSDLADQFEELRFATHGPSSKTRAGDRRQRAQPNCPEPQASSARRCALTDHNTMEAMAGGDLDRSDGEADESAKR